MLRVLPGAGRSDRTPRSGSIHDRIREGRARAEDPRRLPQEQSDQYVGRCVLYAGADGRARVNAAALGGTHRFAQTWHVDSLDSGAPVVVAAPGSVAGLLDDETAPACACRSGVGANRNVTVSRPDLPVKETRAVRVLPRRRAVPWF